jgi:predicted regulator of Ras-like GTPase activity (Roadblock/LC7/MglB family)
MQQLTEDLKSIPGVIGAAVYRSKQGIIANNLPSLFKQERLNDIAKLLVKINSAGRLNFPDLGEVLISFEESMLLCRQLAPQDFLVAICDPSINMNLLAMSMNLAVEEFSRNQPTAATTTPQTTTQAPSRPAPVDLDAIRASGPLAMPLKVMEELLSEVMGPMAGIVFEDALASWSKAAVPATGTLPKLLEILYHEFGDDDKAKVYRDMVRNRLSSRGKK